MTFDASNRKQVREREKALRITQQNRHAETVKIMSTRYGRKYMHDLLESCHIFQTSFVAGSPDTTAFRLGEQNVGLQIFADVIAAAPNEYVLMMSEAREKDLIDERRYSDERSPAGEQLGGENPGRDVEGRIPASVGEYDPYADPGPAEA